MVTPPGNPPAGDYVVYTRKKKDGTDGRTDRRMPKRIPISGGYCCTFSPDLMELDKNDEY